MSKFCIGCGNKLEDDARFCPRCGKAQPASPAVLPAAKPDNRKKKKPQKKKSRAVAVLLIILAAALLLTGVMVTVLLLRRNIGTGTNEEQQSAESYYQENTEIIETTPAEESDTISTEKKAVKHFEDRGFTEGVTGIYTMDGEEYSADAEEDSRTEHPAYQSLFLTEDGDTWTVYEINGAFMAVPLSYLYDSGCSLRIYVTETGTVTSYDAESGTFYETVPDRDIAVVITVDEINADTLNELTAEVLDEYVDE